LTQIYISKKFEKEIVFKSSVLAWIRSKNAGSGSVLSQSGSTTLDKDCAIFEYLPVPMMFINFVAGIASQYGFGSAQHRLQPKVRYQNRNSANKNHYLNFDEVKIPTQ
jgi:hypothetical protein